MILRSAGPTSLLLLWCVTACSLNGCRCTDERARGGPSEQPPVPSAVAPPAPAPDKAPKPPDRGGKLPFWKVTSEGATLYLLASIPIAAREFYPLPDRIENAFNESDTLVIELPLDPATRMAATKKLVGAAAYVPPESLSQSISPQTQKLLEGYLQKTNALPDSFEGSRPWFVAASIYLAELGRTGFQRDLDPDMHFYGKASTSHKKVEALQAVEEQVKFYEALPETTQELVLRQTLEALPSLGERMQSVTEAWNHGDVTALDWLMLGPYRTPEYEPVLLKLFVEPNADIRRKLDGYLAQRGKFFAIVSASHLIGKGGLIELFGDKKYTLEQP